MSVPAPDVRGTRRQEQDEQIASEPPLPTPNLPPDVVALPIESYLASPRRPLAVAGVVENGLVRPLDPSFKLPEHSRVIIVASER